jgi:hypothetical protein
MLLHSKFFLWINTLKNAFSSHPFGQKEQLKTT